VPRQVEQCELSGPPPAIRPAIGPGGAPYARARVLARLHSRPLGFVDVAVPIESAALRQTIEAQLGDELKRSDPAEPRRPAAEVPFVSVVIPTRDRPELLRRTLDSVLACDYPADRLEVLVADNVPSDDGTRSLVDELARGDERLSYLLAPRPGSGPARNDGVARARGEIVAFVDDDAVADRHWLAELVAGFDAAHCVMCVTGLVVAAELDTWAQQLFEEYGGFGKGFENALYDLGANRPPQAMFPFNPGMLGSGNNVAFRADALRALGGYDPALGNGTPSRSAEDWELFLRLLRRGFTAAYRPGAIVHHRHRRELPELESQLHDYGVGLGAAITRTVVHDPGAVLEIARRLPTAAYFLLSSRSSKNRAQSGSYPRELRRAELAGLVRGPAAYLRSRRAGRSHT